MNYTELEQLIQNTCETSETTFVSHINDFIRGAEDAVFNAIKGALFWKAEVNDTFTIGVDQYTVAGGAIDTLDFYVTGADANTDGNEVKLVDHSFLRNAYPWRLGVTPGGVPKYYSIIEANVPTSEVNLTLKVAPSPDAAYSYTISYYGKATTDSITSGNTPGGGATTVTWMSVAFPDVLTYGALERAYIFLKGDPQDIGRYADLFKEQLTLLKNMTEGRVPTDDSTAASAAESKGI